MILEREEQLSEALAASPVVIVQFGAEDCGPCHALREKILSWRRGHPKVGCLYVDVARFPALCAQRGVFTVPTVEVWVEGRLGTRTSGYFSLEDLLRQIERYEALLY